MSCFSVQDRSTEAFPWDVSSVTSMHSMFCGAAVFDGDISKWDVSRVVTMTGMFQRAASFNTIYLEVGCVGCDQHAQYVL